MLHPALAVAVEHISHYSFLLSDDDANLEVACLEAFRATFRGICYPDAGGECSEAESSTTESYSDSYQLVGAELGA